MGIGNINHGDLFPEEEGGYEKSADVDEFISQMKELMQNMNKSKDKIIEESEHIKNIKDEIDEMKEDPIDNSSAYVLALDREHEDQPTFFYSNKRDEEEIEYLVKSLVKQLPRAVVVDLFHELFHELKINDDDLHESIVWKTNKAAKNMKGINPAVLQALQGQNRQN